ncbi:MAG TPA: sulfotransferase domain-containing protein, partial [Fimbriimonas sp.]
MARPNCFIVGAPKCGTTSLYNWLKDHPQVFFSSTKEPHFFTQETRSFRPVTRLDDYLRLFQEAGPGHRVVGEGSTTYLHSPGALERVRDFAPEAKILVSVRNPLEMVPSMYEHNVFHLTEDAGDFEEAWRLSPERRQGRRMPVSASQKIDPVQADYQLMGLLGSRVEHAMAVFPKEQVHVVVFDDIRADPAGVDSRIQEFLGLDLVERPTYDSRN